MAKLFIDKSVMAVLHQLGTELKAYGSEFAVPGILFVKNGKKRVVCGCAFPKGAEDGCEAAGAVTRRRMAHTYSAIYKNGYIPVGLVMLSPVNEDSVHLPYGSAHADRQASFGHLASASVEFKEPLLIVIDDCNKGYKTTVRRQANGSLDMDSIYKCRRITKDDLTKRKGGVAWISYDSWVSSTLQHMGIKQLQ